MELISERAKGFTQGAIREMFDRAAKLDNVISLGIGEPDMHTPAAICQAATDAMARGLTHYTTNLGLIETRRAISAYLEQQGFHYQPETEIMLGPGGIGVLALALNVLLNPGDEVLIQDPQWLNHVNMTENAGGVAVRVPAYEEHGFVMQPADIEACITPRTKALIINYPNNPTGAVASREQLQAIAEVALKHDILVISDEVYNTLIYDGLEYCSIASLPGMRDHTLMVNSFSKAFAMTGWRVGYAAGPSELVIRMGTLQENTCSCVNAFTQAAAAYALTRSDIMEEMRQVYAARRDYIVPALNSIDKLSCPMVRGAFYVFLNISACGLSSAQFCDRLLDEARVVCVPGSAFGPHGEGFIRISYCNSMDNLKEAVERIRAFVASL